MSEIPEKPKIGPPAGNLNNFRTGIRSKRRTFPISGLGKKYAYINQFVAQLRRRLESDVLASRGVVTLGDDVAISTACTWEQTRQLAARRIAEGITENILTDSKTSALAASERDKAIKKLHLSEDTPVSEWDEIDAMGVADRAGEEEDEEDGGEEEDEASPIEDEGGGRIGEETQRDPDGDPSDGIEAE